MTVREFLENIREKLRRLFFLNVPVTKEELEEKKEELLCERCFNLKHYNNQ